jgi:hypothetical protein
VSFLRLHEATAYTQIILHSATDALLTTEEQKVVQRDLAQACSEQGESDVLLLQ